MRVPALIVAAVLSVAAISTAGAQAPFPDRIDLPPGFSPEGIAIQGNTFYVGSIPTGAIYSGSLRTGEGDILVEPQPGRSAIGMKVDQFGRLFVAGGGTGDGYVYDARTGDELAHFNFTDSSATFVNDVIVTQDAAWFTDSRNAVLYRVPIAPNGELGDFEVVPLTGDLVLAPGNNLNGIAATQNGDTLIAVQTNTGKLFTITPQGVTTEIDLGGENVLNGDGLVLQGRTLYVVQNRFNLVAEVRLSPDLSSGTVVDRITSDDLSVPSTAAKLGNSLYLVNARFGVTNPDGEFWLTRIDR